MNPILIFILGMVCFRLCQIGYTHTAVRQLTLEHAESLLRVLASMPECYCQHGCEICVPEYIMDGSWPEEE